MHTGRGTLSELILDNGFRLARISCPSDLIPAPGQYLLAHDGSNSPLPVPLFYAESAAQDFLAAPPIPETWLPGTGLFLRGPLGRGFSLPASARRVALVAFEDSSLRLRGLISPGLAQGAAVVLVCESAPDALPDEVEVQPLRVLPEVIDWAEYTALDVERENLPKLKQQLGLSREGKTLNKAQVLMRTPLPCGALAECGVCAVTVRRGWKMACKDGPVFELNELGLERD